jgi:hypothetical protein
VLDPGAGPIFLVGVASNLLRADFCLSCVFVLCSVTLVFRSLFLNWVLQGWSSWTSSFAQEGPGHVSAKSAQEGPGPVSAKSEDRVLYLLVCFCFGLLVPRLFIPKAGSAVLIFFWCGNCESLFQI